MMAKTANQGVQDSTDRIVLDDLQLDALAETFNLSLGEAAAVFSQLVQEEIELSVPTVELVPREQMIERLKELGRHGDTERLCSITQEFDAQETFQTDTMLIFPEKDSLEIVRRMLNEQATAEAITELEQDALAEIGNIIINGCMSSISNLFHKEISGTLPEVVISDARSLLTEHCSADDVLVARIGMHLAVQNVSGYVLFMMDISSIRNFLGEIEHLFNI
ncbi:MAG: chemotaxis protein CheC [Gammaproteobacteria bacterium]|nr:chemotaxis protein CheC [Gammaproteobacteria bacterium]MCB1926039.1 chemotaxis protein CheC [Gammaproteobacteria bacterium]